MPNKAKELIDIVEFSSDPKSVKARFLSELRTDKKSSSDVLDLINTMKDSKLLRPEELKQLFSKVEGILDPHIFKRVKHAL